VIKVTAGADAPERCNQAFTVAATAVASDVPVSLWLTGEAAWFALPGRADGFTLEHAAPLPVYDDIRDAAAKTRAQRFTAPGKPVATRDAILTLVDSDNPPLRLFLGESPLRVAVEDYGSRLATWAQWQQVAAAAQGSQG